jgi:protein SCO1/2
MFRMMIGQPRRRRIAVAALAILGLGAGAALLAVHRPSDSADASLRIGGHFALATPDGRAVTDASYRGKWLLIYFGYTFCPDACPTALNTIGTALDRLGPSADKVQALFITVDPERDTPPIVADYVKSFDPRIIGLVGTPEQIAAAAKDYRVYYITRSLGGGDYTVDHSSFFYVVDPRGEFARLLTGDLPGHALADELRRLMQ